MAMIILTWEERERVEMLARAYGVTLSYITSVMSWLSNHDEFEEVKEINKSLNRCHCVEMLT